MPADKTYRPRADWEPLVTALLTALETSNPGVTFHVGGSYRRNAPEVGDLDVVAVTDDGTLAGVLLPSAPLYTATRRGPKIVQGDLNINSGMYHIDFWSCAPNEVGAFLWFITGPKELNVAMRESAKKRGWTLSQTGLLDVDGKQMDDGSEEDIAARLGWKPLTPSQRQAWAPTPGGARLASNQRRVPSSNGQDEYVITVDGDDVHCTCKGYQYRGSCRHTIAVRAEAAADQLVATK